ncbi:chymotrypsin-2-like [Calliphora vicina]|uniref:chymotrypsin-2-like n=1 Tax=Calliphora vicina TaxID=7373 RepID=UPI00325B0F91
MKFIKLVFVFAALQIVNGNAIVTQNNNTERIVGGRDIPKGQFVPYQVSLQYYTQSNNYKHYCGGSIISKNLVLTAAHCCKGLKVHRMFVKAGVRDLSESQGKRYAVQHYQIHPNYKEFESSDIAIIKIDNNFDLNNISVAAIDVVSPKRVVSNVEVTLTGWGLRLPIELPIFQNQLQTLNFPTVLQTMSYNTISDKECRSKGIDRLSKTEICAQGFLLKGACVGDSGGPLVRYIGNKLQQVGVVSYGFFVCGVFDVPDVYTRVSEFSDWLQQNIARNS